MKESVKDRKAKQMAEVEAIKEDLKKEISRKLDKMLGKYGYGLMPIASELDRIVTDAESEAKAGAELMEQRHQKAIKMLLDFRFAKEQNVKVEGEVKSEGLKEDELKALLNDGEEQD